MRKKNILKGSIISLLLMPLIVLAESEGDSMIGMAIIWVAFETIHWSFGVFKPLSEVINPEKKTTIFWILFIARVILLVIVIPMFDFAFLIDFFALFVAVFVTGIITSVKGIKATTASAQINTQTIPVVSVPQGILVCPKCGRKMAFGNTKCVVCGTSLTEASILCPKCKNEVKPGEKFCGACGEPMTSRYLSEVSMGPILCPKCKNEVHSGEKFCGSCGENVEKIVEEASKTVQSIERAYEGTPFDKSTYNPAFFMLNEETALKGLIKKEMDNNPDSKGKSLPSIEKKKLVGTMIYSVICFILISIYVSFHTYLALGLLLWVVATIIYFKITLGYSIEKYLLQEVKKRPDEKISYIVSSTLSGATSNRAIYLLAKGFVMALWIISSLVLYSKPHMIYEKTDKGYSLRYYTYGILQQEEKVVVPDTYKGETVIGIRGDTFKNVKSMVEVVIPDTVDEIRGGTFEGCGNLERVTLPKELKRIGGAAFKDCWNLETIEIPETVTEIGGESFSGCVSLKGINLPPNLTEIRGDTFYECTSLESIIIPEGVERIGGSAFRYCSNLKDATIPASVKEIGSSAFRGTSLDKVCISRDASVNERAFKETYATIVYYENNCEASSNYYESSSSDDYGY